MSDSEDDASTVQTFVGEGEYAGQVGMAFLSTPLLEINDQIVPGVIMSPAEAREIGQNLIEMADYAEGERE